MIHKKIRDPLTYAIIGAAMNVHGILGHGFLEAVYQESMEYELVVLSIPFQREFPLPIQYRDHILKTSYRTDFLCYDSIIVELKALQKLTGNEEAQIINYLKASGLEKALLINFGASSLEYKRLILSPRKSEDEISEDDPQISQIRADLPTGDQK